MDLVGRVGVAALVLILLAGLMFLITQSTASQTLTQQQAVQFVLKDQLSRNPTANISVVNVSSSKLKANSWNIVLSVVYNGTKPCPTLFIEQFDYPATGLVPSINNLYTQNCTIYGLSTAPTYVISSPQIAIARSYGQHIPVVVNYVNQFGYTNVNVYAKFYPYINLTATNLGKTFYNSWVVNYTAPRASYSVYVVMDASGATLGNYTRNR